MAKVAATDRLVTPQRAEEDSLEASLRPKVLAEFVGQQQARENLSVFIAAAKSRGEALDHVLFSGPPGLGKTTLAQILARELGVNFRSTSGPVLAKAGDLAAILTNLEPRDVLFIDEIHRLSPAVEEILYPAMEDFELDLVIGEGPSARSVKISLAPFTLVGATTRSGLITTPLRDRFGIPVRLNFYSADELLSIVERGARVLGFDLTSEGAREIAGRARGTPRIAGRLLKRVREHTGSGGDRLVEMLRASPENRDLPLDEEPYRTALQMAEFLDGVPRYPKMHPCGLVLSRQPMNELTPTFIASKGYATTHFDMDAVEAIGLVKMDILAQGGLAAMRDVKAMLCERGIEVDLEHCLARDEADGRLLLGNPQAPEPWQDPAVWEMIAGGGARAVHHIESPAMTSLCRMCNVREINGLVAIVSVIRPGAANEGKKLAFTRRYQGLEPVTYPHPSLEACLRSTYGLVVYEEHILQLSEAFAGLNPGRADVLRRALNKQNHPVIEKICGEFFQSALARGHSPEKTAEVWELVTGFAGYAFCKAHSTAYGVEAYQSAWLKKHFPVEFMAAVLSNGKGFYHPIVYVLECHRLGIKLMPPSINRPGPLFKPEGQLIRVPVRCVKGLTERTSERILTERDREPFSSLADFHRRVAASPEEMEIAVARGGVR